MNDTKIQLIAVRDLLPNPFRNIARYEIHEEKVEQLIASFNSTGVWPTIVARPGAKNGCAEIAFGHHRREALRRRHKEDLNHKVNVNVVPLSDEEMLKMMAAENQEEFHSSFFVTIETVEAVINAAAEGKIAFDDDSGKTASGPVIGRFLNWRRPDGRPLDKVILAMQALAFIKEDILSRDDFRGLNEYQARNLLASASAAQTAYRQREGIDEPLKELEEKEALLKRDSKKLTTTGGKARMAERIEALQKEKSELAPKAERAKVKTAKTMRSVVKKLKAGQVAGAQIRETTFKEMGGRPAFKGIPDIDRFLKDLCNDLWHVLNERHDKARIAKIRSLAENRTDVGEKRINSVKGHLEAIAGRALDLAASLGPLPAKLIEVRKLLALANGEE